MTSEIKTLLVISAVTIVVLIIGVAFLSRPPKSPAPTVDAKFLVREDSFKTASASAKVTLVEFGDYQCPACKAAHPSVKQLVKDYADKINFVFRNFPLPQHKNAQISAEAAEAAGVQGKFWEMHDKLYQNQNVWSESNQPLVIFTGYAKELGLDTAKFQNDVSTNKFSEKINRDQNDANALEINGTPTFFINNKRLDGISSYSDFKNAIDKELK
ncbi:DsbA family protein [Candidatus Woesebacteria bacterium]|nr:DsbA family protein [Candidatus Woesebacteria bacterium]